MYLCGVVFLFLCVNEDQEEDEARYGIRNLFSAECGVNKIFVFLHVFNYPNMSQSFNVDGVMVVKGDMTTVDQEGQRVQSPMFPTKYVQGSKEQFAIAKKTNNGILYNTTRYWEEHGGIIPAKGQIIVYSDGGQYTQGNVTVYVPKIKIGDGVTQVAYLPFVDDDIVPYILAQIGDGTLTIQMNGTVVDTFKANAKTDKTINIMVPVNASDVGALPDSTKYAAALTLSINTYNYVMSIQLKDQNGDNIGSAASIDLPLESMIVDIDYDSETKELILALQSGSVIRVPIGDIVSGLQPLITEDNKLDYSLIDNAPTNVSQFTNDAGYVTSTQLEDVTEVTAAALNELNFRIRTVSEALRGGDYIEVQRLKVTREIELPEGVIPERPVQSDWNEGDSSSLAYIRNKPSLATVATSGDYNDLNNKPTIPDSQIQSDWEQSDNTKKDYIKNKPSLADVATSGDYDDLTNKPTIPAAQVNSDWNSESGVSKILNKPTIPSKTSDLTNDSNFITEQALKDPSEVAAAALNDHEQRIGAVEDMLGGGDGIELKRLVVTRELDAPNLNLDIKNVGAQSTAATIVFPSKKRSYVMMTAAANITLNVTADASRPGENYVLLKNTSGSEITVTIGTVNGSGSNILIPEGGIAVPAGMYVEISYIVSSSMTIVSASSALTLKS